MKVDPSSKKMLLRDWMTATTQVLKVRNPHKTPEDLAVSWNEKFEGLKMTGRWINKALYGSQKLLKK